MNEINIISQIRSKFSSVTDVWLFCKNVYKCRHLTCNVPVIWRYGIVGVYQHYGVPLLGQVSFHPNVINHEVDFTVRQTRIQGYENIHLYLYFNTFFVDF
jgi:hypothetical protein